MLLLLLLLVCRADAVLKHHCVCCDMPAHPATLTHNPAAVLLLLLAQAQLQQFKLSESLTAAQRKQRNAQYKAALEAQIAEAEARQVLDDVFMAGRERELNRQLIVTARGMMSSMGA
jgi:glutamate mutase epsilon subunit